MILYEEKLVGQKEYIRRYCVGTSKTLQDGIYTKKSFVVGKIGFYNR